MRRGIVRVILRSDDEHRFSPRGCLAPHPLEPVDLELGRGLSDPTSRQQCPNFTDGLPVHDVRVIASDERGYPDTSVRFRIEIQLPELLGLLLPDVDEDGSTLVIGQTLDPDPHVIRPVSHGRASLGWRVCFRALTPSASGNPAQLQDASSSQGQNNDRPKNHGEQQGNSQRQMTVEDQEGHLHGLLILKDENEDQQQGKYSKDERR
jgi:hypothetical protein